MSNSQINVNPIVVVLLAPVVLVIAAMLHDSGQGDLKTRDVALEKFAKNLFPDDNTLTFSRVEPIPQYGATAVRLVFEGHGEAWHRDPRAVHNDVLMNRILKQDDYFMTRGCGAKDDVLIDLMGKFGLEQVVAIVRQPPLDGPQFVRLCSKKAYHWETHQFDW